MLNKKVSAIIPACNEEQYLKQTIDSLRNQDYSNIEIVIVVNGSKDNTYTIAKEYADKALFFPEPLRPARARIKGVEKAEGDIFLFLDADTQLSKNMVSSLIEVAESNFIGTCLAKPDKRSIRAFLFFGSKNLMHSLKIVKSVIDGVIFCSRDLYFKSGGFNKNEIVAEFHKFIKRALKVGGKYKCLTNCYAVVSTRRYEKKGYFKIIFYWFWWKIQYIFRKEKDESEEYWSDQ